MLIFLNIVLVFAEQRKDITAASASMLMGNKICQTLREHRCVMAQIRPENSKTLWKKVSEVSHCPFDESEPSTQQTTSTISTKGFTTIKSISGKQVDKKQKSGERKPLAEKLVNTTDTLKINKGDEGEVTEGNGGASRIIQANSVMLVITMHFIN